MPWRPFRALVGARARMLMQYRAAALAGLITQVFWGFIRMMIFEALYLGSGRPQPMTLAQVISYTWLGQAFFRLLPWAPDPDVRQAVRTGSVAVELVRPVDLYAMWYGRALASVAAPAALRAVPLMALALAFFGLTLPGTPAAALAWAAASFAALQSVCLLWSVSGEGLAQLVPLTVFVLSGLVVPIPLLPEPVIRVMEVLPFCGIMDTPLRLWSGHLPASAAPALMAHQLAWTLAIVLFGRWLLRRFLDGLEIHGG
jgi:ABC-2 type transport system permease protein